MHGMGLTGRDFSVTRAMILLQCLEETYAHFPASEKLAVPPPSSKQQSTAFQGLARTSLAAADSLGLSFLPLVRAL